MLLLLEDLKTNKKEINALQNNVSYIRNKNDDQSSFTFSKSAIKEENLLNETGQNSFTLISSERERGSNIIPLSLIK